MNPDYLWLTEALELLTFFVIGPMLAVAIAYTAWRVKPPKLNPEQYGMMCVASGVIFSVLMMLANWLNADVRTAKYFLQLACILLSGLLSGVFMGCGFAILLHFWRWHKRTRLTDDNQTER